MDGISAPAGKEHAGYFQTYLALAGFGLQVINLK